MYTAITCHEYAPVTCMQCRPNYVYLDTICWIFKCLGDFLLFSFSI